MIGASMGGYGALLLAERFGTVLTGRAGVGDTPATVVRTGQLPPMVTAVAALSPAIFGSFAAARAANHAAFDSAAEFARNDVFAGARGTGQASRPGSRAAVDDPVRAADRRAARPADDADRACRCREACWPGCHDDAFWARNLPAALRFLAARYAL